MTKKEIKIPNFALEDYYLNKKTFEIIKKAAMFKLAKRLSEEKEDHWSEWFDWATDNIYETMYNEVPVDNWSTVDIEFEHKDGSISKAYMRPYEKWTDEHCNWPCDTSTVVRWRFLYDWEEEVFDFDDEDVKEGKEENDE